MTQPSETITREDNSSPNSTTPFLNHPTESRRVDVDERVESVTKSARPNSENLREAKTSRPGDFKATQATTVVSEFRSPLLAHHPQQQQTIKGLNACADSEENHAQVGEWV